MKVISSIFAVLMFSMMLTGSVSAQAASKFGFVNTAMFSEEKTGITKLVNANKQVDTEFAARIKELQDGNTKLQAIANELQNMQKLPPAQFNQTAYSNKADEGERLQRDLNYKKQDLERDVPKRRDVVVGPISNDIGKALDEYGAKNGYTAIFDIAKLAETGALLTMAQTADVTKDFITFFNARPATAAAPK